MEGVVVDVEVGLVEVVEEVEFVEEGGMGGMVMGVEVGVVRGVVIAEIEVGREVIVDVVGVLPPLIASLPRG